MDCEVALCLEVVHRLGVSAQSEPASWWLWEAWEGDAQGEGLFAQHEGGPCLLLGGQQPTTGLCAECDVCEEGW